MEQCDGCRKQREIQWGRARELLEQVLQQVSGTVRAATIVSREQAFFAGQVEQAMRLAGLQHKEQWSKQKMELQ